MSTQGIIIIDILAVGLIILIINLLRNKKLTTGYALIWLISVGTMLIILNIPPFLDFVTKVVGAVYPASALSLLAFVLIFMILIFFSVQISILSARQVDMIQEISFLENGLRQLKSEEKSGWADEIE